MEPTKIRLKVKDIFVEIREDNRGGIVFETEDGHKYALMTDEYGERKPLNLLEL